MQGQQAHRAYLECIHVQMHLAICASSWDEEEILGRAMTRDMNPACPGVGSSTSDIARSEREYMRPVVPEQGEHTRIWDERKGSEGTITQGD